MNRFVYIYMKYAAGGASQGRIAARCMQRSQFNNLINFGSLSND